MTKFFRKIRQKLLQENRVLKYLIYYAFGEIIFKTKIVMLLNQNQFLLRLN